MTKYFIQIGLCFLILFSLLLEKGLHGTFPLFSFMPISLIILVYLINGKNGNSYVGMILIYGLFLDIINKSFWGLTSLIYVVSLYLFYWGIIRFKQNKFALGLVNLIFITILSLGYYGFENYSIEVVYTALIVAIATVYAWIKG